MTLQEAIDSKNALSIIDILDNSKDIELLFNLALLEKCVRETPTKLGFPDAWLTVIDRRKDKLATKTSSTK